MTNRIYYEAATVQTKPVSGMAAAVARAEEALRSPAGAALLGGVIGLALSLAGVAFDRTHGSADAGESERTGAGSGRSSRSLLHALAAAAAVDGEGPDDSEGAAAEGAAAAAADLRGELHGSMSGPKGPSRYVARLVALDGGGEVARAPVGVEGDFTLRAVPPGCYRLDLDGGRARAARASAAALAGDAGRVCIAEGGTEFIAIVLVE